MERLTKRSYNGTGIYATPSGDPEIWGNNRHKVLQKLADYEDLEEQGRLLKLPCKVGDRLYWIDEEDDYGNEVLCIKQYGEDELVRAVGIDEDGDMFAMIGIDRDTEIPATIGSQYALLTMEDAENMLEEMRGSKNGKN